VPPREVTRAINLHFHDLRHEAGCRWLEAGWPIHYVQEMLGHTNLSQTSTYTQPNGGCRSRCSGTTRHVLKDPFPTFVVIPW
jgi:integrase